MCLAALSERLPRKGRYISLSWHVRKNGPSPDLMASRITRENALALRIRRMQFGALCAPGFFSAEAGTRAAAPFPAPLSPLAASFLRCASDRFLLTKPNTSCTIEAPAPLRSDGVRDHPGVTFGIIPDSAFGFAGIPIRQESSVGTRHLTESRLQDSGPK